MKKILPSYEGRNARSWLRHLDLDAPEADSKAAEQAFAAMGTTIVPWLVEEFTAEKLSDKHAAKLARAFHALGSQAVSAIPDLLRLVDKHPDYITHALSGVGEEAGPALMHLIRHSNGLVRVRACEALKDAVGHGRVSRSAVIELVPEVIGFLQNDWHLLRWRAASLLGAIRATPERCIPALISCLEDKSSGVQGAAAAALGGFGDVAVAALPQLLDLAYSQDVPLRSVVISALGCFSDPRVMPVLIAALHDPQVSTAAIYSLGRGQWPPDTLVPVLCDCVSDGDYIVRWAATEILARLGERAITAIPVLRMAASDAPSPLRNLILRALESIENGDKKSA